MQGADDETVAALRRGDLDSAPVTDKQRVLLELVRVLTEHPWRCNDDDVQKLRDARWSEPEIAEAVYITAMFAFFNRVADAFGLLDPQYDLKPTPTRPAIDNDG